MHRCLHIEDVLIYLFNCIPASAQFAGGRKALLELALTCKCFLEPALNVLWQHQNQLIPLLKILPADAWSYESGDSDQGFVSVL